MRIEQKKEGASEELLKAGGKMWECREREREQGDRLFWAPNIMT